MDIVVSSVALVPNNPMIPLSPPLFQRGNIHSRKVAHRVNIGFHRLVKIDQRLEKEFPRLLPSVEPKPKELFVAAWKLADALGMTPFELDHLLYQWGNSRLVK